MIYYNNKKFVELFLCNILFYIYKFYNFIIFLHIHTHTYTYTKQYYIHKNDDILVYLNVSILY